MNKVLLGLVIFFCLFYVSCNQEKITRLYTQLLLLENENNILKEEINNLKDEIENLKETDQYYYQSGATEFSNGNFDVAINWMNKLKIKFPTSELLTSADKLIRDSNTQKAAIYERERTNLNQLIREARNLEIEVAISRLEAYVRENHPSDLIQTASQSLNIYKEEYEKVRTVRQSEQRFGVRLIDYRTGWGMHTFFGGERLFIPQMVLQFRNISGYTLSSRIEIKVDFLNTGNNEMFGSDSSYLIGYEESMQADFLKSVFINGSRGYRSEWSSYELSSLPSLEARIYINGSFYKSQNIQKQYRR